MANKFRQIHLRVDDELFEIINNISNRSGVSANEVCRDLLRKGLSERIAEDNADLIATVVKQQVELAIKPSIERLAALSSKSGHMSARATFLTVQAFMDLVPTERRKDVKSLYEKACIKAVEYMKSPASDFDLETLIEDVKSQK